MSVLDSILEFKYAFYRALGSLSTDDALVENGETADDVLYLYGTRGIRAAQRWLIGIGMGHRWQKRSAAITWSGTDAADGGRYVALSTLASDFMRLNRKNEASYTYGALVEADGKTWGEEVDADLSGHKGDFYYLKTDKLWIARTASPPTTLYLDYFYQHPALSAATASFDFPTDAMHLALWEAVDSARAEAWFPLADDADRKIEKALDKARGEAKEIAKQSRTPRRMRRPRPHGTRW